MTSIMYHGGRGGAATKGWKLEQLVYASLKTVFSEKDIEYQFVSPHLRCTPDFLVRLKEKNAVISITSGPDKVARRYTSNSKYPFWETMAELFYIKTSADPEIVTDRDVCVNIIFGRRDFWVPWLISAFETIFEDTLFPQYCNNKFHEIENELNKIYLQYTKRKTGRDEFPNHLLNVIPDLPKENGVRVSFENLVEYLRGIKRTKPRPFQTLWSMERKHLKRILRNLHSLDDQLQKYGEPCDRPSFRWHFIANAIFNEKEIDVIKAVDAGADTIESISKAVGIATDRVDTILQYLEELGIVGTEPHSLLGKRYYIEGNRPEIVNSIRMSPPLDNRVMETVISQIVKERSGELQENFQALKEWDKFFSPIRLALSHKNSLTTIEDFKQIWNRKEHTSLYRKILLDVANLKQNDFMDVLGVYADQIVFYYKEFTTRETEIVCSRVFEALKRIYGDINSRVSDIEGDSRARFSLGRIWGDLNNPKLAPYLHYIDQKLKEVRDIDTRKGFREESFFPNLIKEHSQYLRTYPQHAKDFPPNSGIVESHWVIEKSGRRWFVKSRFSDFDTIDHRRPEECGRCRCARYIYDASKHTFLEKDNLIFVFIPDGFWREEDLWFLVEAGYKIYLTVEEFIENELLV